MKNFLTIFCLFLSITCWSDDFDGWKKLSTEHFLFIYEEIDETTAFELADYSEEIYKKVTTFFDFYPSRIPVYLNSRIDSPNGMFYPIPGSINLYPVYPLNSENSTKGNSWLYELLLHEMVHYVQLENRKGLFGILSYPFGKDLSAANGAFLPAWMIEGIAVYLETFETEGGRGRNQYFTSIMKAAAIEEDFFTINQLAYSSDFPPYDRIYSGGYALTKYIIEQFGVDIFQKVYLRYIKFPFFGPFGAIEKETGIKLKDIFEDFKAEEIRKYSPDRDIYRQFPSEKKSPDHIGSWTHPVKTDKGIFFYTTGQNEQSRIILYDEATGNHSTVLDVTLMDSSSFSVDSKGDTIVFASGSYSLYHSYGYSLISDIYLYSKGKVTKLSRGESLFQPAISSDGEKIIAVKRIGSYSSLVSIDRDNGVITELFKKNRTNVMNPVFSPDSGRISFVLNDHGFQDIYLMNPSEPDSAFPIMGIDRNSEYYPRFTDDNNITFISDRDTDLSLFAYDLNKGSLTLIFKDPVGVADGLIEDGKIYYSSYRTKGYEFRQGEIPNPRNYEFNGIKEIKPESPLPGQYETKTYIDWAFPYLWLPKPYLQMTEKAGNLWGFGAAVFAGSLARSGQWILDLNYMPAPAQLSGVLDYSRKLGTTTFDYNLIQTYNEFYNGADFFWRQGTEQSVRLTIPIAENSQLNWRNLLQTFFSFKYKILIDDFQPFSLDESFEKTSREYIYAGGGVSLNNYKINYPARNFFGELAIFNQFDISVLLPYFSSSETSYLLLESGSLAFPLGAEGFLLKTNWQAAYNNKGVSSAAVNARGWTPALRESDVSLYYTLDYLMPIALVDWGLPFGFNIQNIAAAIHFEGISNFLFSGPSRHEFYGGMELIGTYGYNYGKIPAGAGINFRLYKNGEPFNPSEDIRIYFFLSFNSLF